MLLSSLASAAPMQKWTPPAKLSGAPSARSGLNRSGSLNLRGSLLPAREQRHYLVAGLDGNTADLRVTAHAAGELDGRVVTQHFLDKLGRADLAIPHSLAGRRIPKHDMCSPLPSRFVVVSNPATSSKVRLCSNSASVRRPSAESLIASRSVSRSSRGSARRTAARPVKYASRSTAAALIAGRLPGSLISNTPARSRAIGRKLSRSASGMPISSQITVTGRRYAKSCMNSTGEPAAAAVRHRV